MLTPRFRKPRLLPVLAAALVSAGCAGAGTTLPVRWDHASAKPRPDMTTICAGKKAWADPGPPVPIFGNVYHVGTCTITSLLITSPQGHILIDAPTEAAVPDILANVRKLGFDPRDIRLILNSHEHWDHSGGLAAMKAATSAPLAASPAARAALESGRPDPADPQATWLEPAPPAAVDRTVRDGETVSVGPLRLTLHATPGHAPGSTTWTWRSCEGATCRAFVYADSLSTPAPATYRFTDHPERVAALRAAAAQIAAMDCDVLLTPHPGQSNMYARYAGQAPLVNRAACRDYAAAANTAMDERLASEQKPPR